MEDYITLSATITGFPPFKNLKWELKPGVNFLVGPNGVGKTRLIDSIKAGKLILNGQSTKYDTKARVNRTVPVRNLPYRYGDWGAFEYVDLNEASQDFSNINKNFELCGQPILDEKEIENTAESTRNDKGRRKKVFSIESEFQLHGIEFNSSNMLSQGTKFLFEILNWDIPKNYGEIPAKFGSKSVLNHFIFLEEPENSLHPDIQKKIPNEIVKWWIKQNKKLHGNLFVIVTTHSPFVLKGMGIEHKQHLSCFVMKRDSTALKPLNYNEVIAQGNHLLGVGIGDLLPGRVILAENSIVKLIETISEKLLIEVPAFFVTSGGDGDTDNRIKNIQALQKMLKSLSKSFPERFLLNMSYVVIFDDEEKKESSQQGFKNAPIESFNVIFENLGKLCLEDSYPLPWINEYRGLNFEDKADWTGAGSYTEYCKDVLELKGREIGLHKNTLAEFVGGKISNVKLLETHLPTLNKIVQTYL